MAGPRLDVRNLKYESDFCFLPWIDYRVEDFEYTKDVTVGIRTISLRTVVPKVRSADPFPIDPWI